MSLDTNSSSFGHLTPRKEGHIELTHRAQTSVHEVDSRFNYEPLFFTHPDESVLWETSFLKQKFSYPIWISSMTGGARLAQIINQNLAKLAAKYNLGMGLGSCRSLLDSKEHFSDFDLRKVIGDRPLMSNLGLAQVEELVWQKQTDKIHEMVKSLEATGLMIHLNPLQEWFQPEGDRFRYSPLETITRFLESAKYPVMIKEVGQGMGPKSLSALMELPLQGVEFGAFGGTNFSLLEGLRSGNFMMRKDFIHLGHTASEMVDILNSINTNDKEFIISGGMKSILDGYELKLKLKAPGVIGLASAFLTPAQESFESLEKYFLEMRESLLVARGIVHLKEKK